MLVEQVPITKPALDCWSALIELCLAWVAHQYLILDEGHEWGHHDCHAIPQHTRQLVAEALA